MSKHSYFLYFLIGLITLFFIQEIFSPLGLKKLNGVFIGSQKPDFKLDGFLNNSYQDSLDQYLKDNSSFRGELITLRNQMNYSLFDEINTILTLGKENYVFDPSYIFAVSGAYDVMDSLLEIQSKEVYNTKILLDSLQIPLLYCVAPNKANFYFDKIIDDTIKCRNTLKNKYLGVLNANKIDVIDFDDWFVKQKENYDCALIPKYGAHWTLFGASLAADSVLNKVQANRNISIKKFRQSSLEKNTSARFTDDDYLGMMNLLIKWQTPNLCYPTLQFTKGEKLNVLFISDSFGWTFFDLEIFQNCFTPESEFWYYNHSTFNSKREKRNDRDSKITISQLKNRDLIIILSTSPSLLNFGFDFFKQTSDLVKSSNGF